MQRLELWIGLVELRPLNPKAYRQEHDAASAFTNIVAWASNLEGFHRKAETIAATLNMYVTDIEKAEPLAQRTENRTMTEEIDDMILRAKSNPNAIVHGAFHRYRFDEA